MIPFNRIFSLFKNFLLLWVVLATCFSWTFSTVCIAVIIGAYVRYRIKPVSKESLENLGIFDQNFLINSISRGERSFILQQAGSEDAPGNIMETIRTAQRLGALGVELDLGVTAEGEPVPCSEQSQQHLVDSPTVAITSCSRLAPTNVSCSHSRGTKLGVANIPTLEQALEKCLTLNLFVVLNCRNAKHAKKIAVALDQLYRKIPALYKKCVVVAFYPNILYEVGIRNSEIVKGLLLGPVLSERYLGVLPRVWSPFFGVLDAILNWAYTTLIPLFCGAAFIAVHSDLLNRDLLEHWHGLGLEVMVWRVKDRDKCYFQQRLQVPVITETIDSLPSSSSPSSFHSSVSSHGQRASFRSAFSKPLPP